MASNRPNDVTITGDPNVDDSFVAALCGVLRSWGREADPVYIAGLAGVAFSPALDDGEDCRAWWMEGGSDARIEFLGQALGFSVETVRREFTPADEAWNKAPDGGRVPPNTARFHATLHEAYTAGKTVLIPGWPSWCVLAGWEADVTQMPFLTLPGFEKLVRRAWGPERAGHAYLLTPAEPTLDRAEAVRRAVVHGADVARGATDHGRLHFGGTLYDAFAERLDHTPFCVPCGEESAGCASRTVKRIRGSVNAAVGFLEQAAAVDPAHRHEFSEATLHYKAIADALEPYIPWKTLESGWKDDAYRARFKQDVLEMRAEHDRAARAVHAAAH